MKQLYGWKEAGKRGIQRFTGWINKVNFAGVMPIVAVLSLVGILSIALSPRTRVIQAVPGVPHPYQIVSAGEQEFDLIVPDRTTPQGDVEAMKQFAKEFGKPVKISMCAPIQEQRGTYICGVGAWFNIGEKNED